MKLLCDGKAVQLLSIEWAQPWAWVCDWSEDAELMAWELHSRRVPLASLSHVGQLALDL